MFSMDARVQSAYPYGVLRSAWTLRLADEQNIVDCCRSFKITKAVISSLRPNSPRRDQIATMERPENVE
jgi:hypothetical protein